MAELIVLVGEDVGPANLARLRQAFPRVEFRLCLSVEEFVAQAPQAEVIFTKGLPAAVLPAAGHLRWVQAGTAGVEGMLAQGLRERDILLTNAHGAHGVPMSEVVLGMMLAFATGLHTLIRVQTQRGRVRREVIADKFELEGQTLCVLGLGDIGGTLACKAQQLGMRVLGVRRSVTPFAHVDALYTPEQLLQALPLADHVALCLPFTPETEGIVGARELRAMKPSAHIYNVGRGRCIEPDALLSALQEGWIAGAGLDVTEPEPLPEDSPLWDDPRVILSQHTSGSSPYNADRITSIFQENLARYLSGRELLHVVDKDRGY